MEVHICQCDGRKKRSGHYNEKLSRNNDLVSQNIDLISQNNELVSLNNELIAQNIEKLTRVIVSRKFLTMTYRIFYFSSHGYKWARQHIINASQYNEIQLNNPTN